MKIEEMLKRDMGIDIKNEPLRSVLVYAGREPKYKSKNKYIQKILLKLFGEKPIYKEKKAKVLLLKAEDCPHLDFDGNFTIDFEK